MPSKPGPGHLLILELDKKFPGHSTRGLARMAYRESPGMFKDYEACRWLVKALRNSEGHYKPKGMSKTRFSGGNQIEELPEGDDREWLPFIINGPAKVLVIPDIHIPYHDRAGVLISTSEGKRQDVDTILIGGDLVDFHTLSRFVKDPRARDFPGEVEMVIDFLETLKERFPKARIIWKLGNHEERYDTNMRIKAPELLGLPQFEFSEVFDLRRLGIKLIEEKRPIRLGKLNFIHGHEYPFAFNPVNPARGLFLRSKTYAMCGHFHQPAFHPENTLDLSSLGCWSVGCLCGLHPAYRPLNNWQHGFAIVEVDKNGGFEVQNKVIKGGRIY